MKQVDIDVAGAVEKEPTLGIQPPTFVEYTGPLFRAEVAVIDDDYVFHFYPVKGQEVAWAQFAHILNAAAQEDFEASFPRLKAAYTAELGSWWLRAYAFASLHIDRDAFIQRLYQRMEQAFQDGK